jgi:hypothetical protein
MRRSIPEIADGEVTLQSSRSLFAFTSLRLLVAAAMFRQGTACFARTFVSRVLHWSQSSGSWRKATAMAPEELRSGLRSFGARESQTQSKHSECQHNRFWTESRQFAIAVTLNNLVESDWRSEDSNSKTECLHQVRILEDE